MFNLYKSSTQGLEAQEQPVEGCWLNIVDPNAQEIIALQHILDVPQDFITYPLDVGEIARTEKENSTTLILLRVPHYQGNTSDIPYTTVPLGIIVTDKLIATVSRFETTVVQELLGGQVRRLSTTKRIRFILNLLLIAAQHYLSCLRQINRAVDVTEDRLERSLRNREVLDLLKYQKSLVYFTTALTSNQLMLRRLQREKLFQTYPEDEDLLEDVLVEIQQAIEMVNISNNILSQMMDAFASIISNNLNGVMKFLASITIILSVPTMLASFYGMNVALPAQSNPLAFLVLIVVSLLISAVVIVLFLRRDWL